MKTKLRWDRLVVSLIVFASILSVFAFLLFGGPWNAARASDGSTSATNTAASNGPQSDPTAPLDEAAAAGKTHDYYYPAPNQIENYFKGMDIISVPVKPTPEDTQEGPWPDQLLDKRQREERVLVDPLAVPTSNEQDKAQQLQKIWGRNTWMMWCGGNEAFWDYLASDSHGFLDFLKVIDSRRRTLRWRDAGMVNEPGMRQATAPDEFGLWLDEPQDPQQMSYRQAYIRDFFSASKSAAATYPASSSADWSNNGYAGVPPGQNIPPANVYGVSSGVIGFRLFPNPKFDAAARARWDAKRYYTDPEYYNDPTLVRPFRVGMSCAFCHTSAAPLNPPSDPASPQWENLSGSIGSQYLRMRAIFGNLLKPNNFVYHVLDSQPPGTIDTSLVASDNINNPNTMNAIFGVPQRVRRSFDNPRESLAPAAAALPSLWKEEQLPAVHDLLGTLPREFSNLQDVISASNANPRYVPRILFDGADSIGAWGALARVYLNIGTYHEQWIRLHEPLIGFLSPMASTPADVAAGRTQLPFRIKDCLEKSVYWQATQDRVGALRDYFLTVTPTMPLLDARGSDDATKRIAVEKLARGRQVFARNCIVCHSSIQPETPAQAFVDPKDLKDYLTKYQGIIDQRKAEVAKWDAPQVGDLREAWDHDPGQWLRNAEYEKWASDVVERPDFWRQNYLSSDFRVPVTYVGTNSGRAMATNAITGHMWEDFASDTYRTFPSVGSIKYFNPFSGQDEVYEPRHKVAAGVPEGGGGPGFYRPASLMSVWATAPFLHNNSLGHFNNDPSVKGRLEAFDDAIHKLLSMDRRLANSDYASPDQLQRDHGLIWRTPTDTYLQIRGSDVPLYLRRIPLPRALLEWSEKLTSMGRLRSVPTIVLMLIALIILWKARGPTLLKQYSRYVAYVLMLVGLAIGFVAYLDTGGLGDLRIGPIPAGTPVNLLANINPDAPQAKIKAALLTVVDAMSDIETRHLQGPEKDAVINTRIGPALMSISKCPDFVMDKGHYFSWFSEMTKDDKDALIELLKTF